MGPDINTRRQGEIERNALSSMVQRAVSSLVFIICLVLLFQFIGCAAHQKTLTTTHADQIAVSVASGERSYREGRYPAALEAYESAAKISTESEAFHRLADIYYKMALVYLKQEKFDQALSSCRDALKWTRRNGHRKDEGYLLNRMGAVYQIQGDIVAAKKHYGQALAIRREIGDTLGQARTLANLAYVSFAERRYADALEEYREALILLNDIGPPSYRDIGAVLTQTGSVYAELGQYGRALAFHRKAAAAYEKINDPRGISGAFNNIGTTWYRAKNYEKSIAAFKKALIIRRDAKDSLGMAETLNNLGLAFIKTGEGPQAVSHLNESLALARSADNLGLEAYILDSLGTVHQALGNYEDSLDYFTRSLTFWNRLGDLNGELVTTGNIGSLFEAEGQTDLAIIFYKRSVNMTEEIRGQLKGLPVAHQRSYLESVEGIYRSLAALLLKQGRTAEAIRVVDLLKVQELQRDAPALRGNEQTSSGVPNLTPEAEIIGMHDALQADAVLNGIELEKLRQIPEAMLTHDQERRIDELLAAQKKLRRLFIDFARSDAVRGKIEQLSRNEGYQLMPPPLELRNLQHDLEALSEVTVLLYSLVFKDRIELLLVTPKSPAPIHKTVRVPEAVLNDAILDFRKSLTSRDPAVISDARQFYDWLIRPFAPYLGKDQADARIIINLPDAKLRYIPLAALHDGENWLINSFKVFNITAWSLNGNKLKKDDREIRRVLAGAFTRGSYTISIDGENKVFDGLKFAKTEIDNIVAEVPDAKTLFDTDFTRSATLSRLNDYSIIHFATHAVIVVGRASDSFILLGNGEMLKLNDLEVEDLHNVGLVVLSACETALDNVMSDGREILGFGHIIEQAGASASVASLWEVDDEGTQALMSAFYRELLRKGGTKAGALRSAQLELIAKGAYSNAGTTSRGVELADKDLRQAGAGDFSHPYYWAAFILIGNGF